jgi:DNA helicase II / ATP-dependent DNA helicase PcrA
MNTAHYKKELKKLNSEQRKAVETIEGTVLVIAGPGTGKTQVLTTRIAHILHETDTPPHGVLALTFTDAGAHAMRKRLKQLIGNAAYSVEITTFHSFANSIIEDYPESFPALIGFRQMDELEKLDILESILREGDFELLKPLGDPLFYLKPVSAIIQDIKREGLNPRDFRIFLDKQTESFETIEDLRHTTGKREGEMKGKYKTIATKIRKNFELHRLYERYEDKKVDMKVFDYDDAILGLLESLKRDNDLLLTLQERFLYILVDEHQDSNGAQNMIISYLSSFHENPNLFIVGDDKQAIYRFQGASLDNFLFFSRRYPEAHVIELTDNYRSHQNILDIAHELIQNNATLSKKQLKQASVREEQKPLYMSLPTPPDEALYIAEKVESLQLSNPSASIAVLYRNNADASILEFALEKRGVAYSKLSGTRSELHPYIEQFLTLLAIARKPDDELLAKALFYDCFKLSASDIISFFEEARGANMSLALRSSTSLTKSAEIIQKLLSLHKFAANLSFFELTEEALHNTGLIETILSSPNAQELLSDLQKLHTIARKLKNRDGTITLEAFLAHIQRAKKLNLLKFQESSTDDAGVILSTVHGVKGLEFDSVIISGLENNKWSGKKRRNYFYLPELQGLSIGETGEAEQDQRRLLYVAITRAKESLIITSSEKNEDGRDLVPSRFIDELGNGLIKEAKTESMKLSSERIKRVEHPLLDKKYVEYLFTKRSLNATALNKYLKCPWEYFFVTLLKLPQAPSPSAQYGTAIHNALHRYISDYLSGTQNAEDLLITFFEQEIEHSSMPEDEKRRFKIKGTSDLRGYIHSNPLVTHAIYETERSFSNIPLEIQNLVELRMAGKLDKVEYTDDGLIVTDFKTGKPKSRNFLEGRTTLGSLDYKRQLTFYSELLKRSKLEMKEGVIDFIEPTEKGVYRQERFSITEEDRRELIRQIEDMAREVLSLQFANKGCAKKACEWCKLSESLFY